MSKAKSNNTHRTTIPPHGDIGTCQYRPPNFPDPLPDAITELQAAQQHLSNAQAALLHGKPHRRAFRARRRAREISCIIVDHEVDLRQPRRLGWIRDVVRRLVHNRY